MDDRHEEYGGIGSGDATQPDEEELRREREALEHITSEATECINSNVLGETCLTILGSNMIDVLHPGTADASHHFTNTGSQRKTHEEEGPKNKPGDTEEADEDEEATWLQSIQSTGVGNVTSLEGLKSGGLVMDMSQLRDEPTSTPAKRSLKSNLPR